DRIAVGGARRAPEEERAGHELAPLQIVSAEPSLMAIAAPPPSPPAPPYPATIAPNHAFKQVANDMSADKPFAGEKYAVVEENPIVATAVQPTSTFSIDVDTGSYSNVRRM